MGFFYCSPENSSMQSTFFDTVNKEIQLYSNTHNTYIFGDFNARIQTLCENMPADKFDEQVGICGEMESIPPPRNSEDLKSNTRGKEFLDLCKINNLCIANGRALGDLFGKYTCHQKRGSSVVDYLISPYRALRNIKNFSVGEYNPYLSDHCPVAATIHISTPLFEEKTESPKLTPLPNRYIWGSDQRDTFDTTIKSESFKEKVNELLTMEDNPNLIHKINHMLVKAAEDSKIKTVRKRSTQDPPWFDKECKELKTSITACGKTLRKTPHDAPTRERLYILKKKLRNLIKKINTPIKNLLLMIWALT